MQKPVGSCISLLLGIIASRVPVLFLRIRHHTPIPAIHGRYNRKVPWVITTFITILSKGTFKRILRIFLDFIPPTSFATILTMISIQALQTNIAASMTVSCTDDINEYRRKTLFVFTKCRRDNSRGGRGRLLNCSPPMRRNVKGHFERKKGCKRHTRHCFFLGGGFQFFQGIPGKIEECA